MHSEAAEHRREARAITDGEDVTSLGQAWQVFMSRRGPRNIARTAAITLGLRALAGPPGPDDLVALLGAAAFWPFQEWLAHKYLLHLRPFDFRGKRIDPLFAQKHREHHVEPRDIDNTLLPLWVIRNSSMAGLAIFAVVPGKRVALTAMATYSVMALLYEWTHFLVHTGYKPRSDFYKRVRKNHRLHHYRNERYWLGFTMPLVDQLLGTEPDPRSVPFSKTARDLYGLRAQAEAAVDAGD